MSASPLPRRRLRNRLMLVFAGFTLLLAMLFGLYALLFVYTVEDRLFDTLLEREAAAQQAHYAAHGRWSPPRNGFMAVVERTGIQSAVNWPADEIEKFLADVARLVSEAKHESDSH